MSTITIYGASDDLIEIEGDISEEFGCYQRADEEFFLAVSDGTLLRVEYDNDGIWRITPVVKGRATFSKIDGSVDEDTPDRVTLTLDGEPFRFVALGHSVAHA